MRFLFFVFALYFFACAEAPAPDHAGALPHTGTADTDPALDAAAMEALAGAEGRTVLTVSPAELSAAVDAREEATLVVQFWRLDCADCLQQNEALEAVGVPTIYVNLDGAAAVAAVNAQIRAAGLTGTIYQLSDPGASLPLTNGPVPPLPFFKVLDRQNGVGVDYRRYLPVGALQAVLGSMVSGDTE